eukprot:279733-Pyramimonas_sp.AAC.1
MQATDTVSEGRANTAVQGFESLAEANFGIDQHILVHSPRAPRTLDPMSHLRRATAIEGYVRS